MIGRVYKGLNMTPPSLPLPSSTLTSPSWLIPPPSSLLFRQLITLFQSIHQQEILIHIMANINSVTFNQNTLNIRCEGPLTIQNIDFPGVTSNGSSGPWPNNTTPKGVYGTARKAVVAFNNGTIISLNVNRPRSFAQGSYLTVSASG